MTGIWKTKLARKIGALFAAMSIYLGVVSDIGGVWSFFKDLRATTSQLVVIQGRLTALFRNPGYKKTVTMPHLAYKSEIMEKKQ